MRLVSWLKRIENRAYLRSIQGIGLALLGPLVWVLLKYINQAVLNNLLSSQMLFGLYLTAGAVVVFPGFGAYLGYQEKLANQRALTDPLTHLYNVRYFRQRLDELISERAREGTTLYLAVFDIDHFKKVNDTYGHSVGDKVLESLALKVKKLVRHYDCVARVGGEEFAILYSTSQQFDVISACERILHDVEHLNIKIKHSNTINITISLGITDYRNEDSKDSFYARADKTMYQAKVSGRNQVKFDFDD